MTEIGQRSPFDPDTEFTIERSESPISEDGYKIGEPKILSCEFCNASVLITEDPSSPGVDDLSHERDCPQRFARSQWWRAHF